MHLAVRLRSDQLRELRRSPRPLSHNQIRRGREGEKTRGRVKEGEKEGRGSIMGRGVKEDRKGRREGEGKKERESGHGGVALGGWTPLRKYVGL